VPSSLDTLEVQLAADSGIAGFASPGFGRHGRRLIEHFFPQGGDWEEEEKDDGDDSDDADEGDDIDYDEDEDDDGEDDGEDDDADEDSDD
jgi:hypothetical protein